MTNKEIEGCLKNKELVCVTGLMGTGKAYIIHRLIRKIFLNKNRKVFYFSFEMLHADIKKVFPYLKENIRFESLSLKNASVDFIRKRLIKINKHFDVIVIDDIDLFSKDYNDFQNIIKEVSELNKEIDMTIITSSITSISIKDINIIPLKKKIT